MVDRRTDITTSEQTSVTHRISIGLISLSLGVISLALGTALLLSPGASVLFVSPTVSQQSVPSTATAMTLTWTAPGDNGNVGQAASYDIRYSAGPITADNFSQASAVDDAPLPQPAGSAESYTVNNLQPATTYFFALKTSDAAGNASALSNVVTKTTSALAQACLPTWSCSEWTACLDGRQTRTCTDTNGCQSNLGQPLTSQTCTAPTPPLLEPEPQSRRPAGDSGGPPVRVVKHIVVAAIGPGGGPAVRIIDPATGKATAMFNAMPAGDRRGLNVAAGEVNGDHLADVIVGSGAGDNPVVKVFTSTGRLKWSFNPYPTERKIGVDVAAGDVDGDGIDEIITVPAKSAAQVKIFRFDAKKNVFALLGQTFAYNRVTQPGFTVAAGDLDLDGSAEVMVAARANARSVSIFRWQNNQLRLVHRFNPFPLLFKSGLTIAVGDTSGDGRPEIIVTAGPGYYSHLKFFDINGRLLTSFRPTSIAYHGGLDLTALDVNQDGRDEILTTTYRNGDPGLRVYRYDAVRKTFTLIQNYFIFARTIKNGFRLGSI